MKGCSADCECESRCSNLHNINSIETPSSPVEKPKIISKRVRRPQTMTQQNMSGLAFHQASENAAVKYPWSSSEDIILSAICQNPMSTDSETTCTLFNCVRKSIGSKELNPRTCDEITTRTRHISNSDERNSQSNFKLVL